MKKTLISRFQTEYAHFLKLSQAARSLLISFSFYEFVLPLIFGFINAFLFRQTASFSSVVMYNIGLFVAIPTFFYINGLLMRFFSLKSLFIAGMVGQGLVLNCLFFLPTNTWLGLVGFGLLQGAFVGLYWANRNFISIEITTDSNRTYFVGLEQIFAIGSELVAPLLIGGVISLGTVLGWYQADVGYQILGVFSLAVLVFGSFLIRNITVEAPEVSYLFVKSVDKQWWFVRLAEIIYGCFHGSYMFLPSLLVFSLVGEEGVLGVMQSVAAVLTMLLTYYFSRKLRPTQRVFLTLAAVSVLVVISIFLSATFTSLAAVVLILLASPINKLRWIAWSPTVMTAIDAQDNGNPAANYAFVCDRELWMNIGRLLGIAFFMATIQLASEQDSIRYTPLFIALTQLVFVFALHQVLKLQAKIVR